MVENSKIPDHCIGCTSIIDGKCHYDGHEYDDFDVDIDEASGKGECYTT